MNPIGMNPIEDAHGNPVSIHEFLYLMYQGFGQYAVSEFVDERQKNRQLSDVVWQTCPPCETAQPTYGGACLVCSTEVGGE